MRCGLNHKQSWDQRQPVGVAAVEEGVGSAGLPLSCRGCWARLEACVSRWRIPAVLGREWLRPAILGGMRVITCDVRNEAGAHVPYLKPEGLGSGREGKGGNGARMDGTGWDGAGRDGMACDDIG